MFRYILTALLIITYYSSLGNPLPEVDKTINLVKSFEDLSSTCRNAFISSQIKNRTSECNLTVTAPSRENPFQCLIFYDINRQLCNAVNTSNLIVDNYTDQINASYTLDTLCKEAKKWSIKTLIGSSLYEQVEEILNTSCVRACGTSNLEDQEANFYCKYYKWGSDLLKIKPTEPNGGGILKNNTVGDVEKHEKSDNAEDIKIPNQITPENVVPVLKENSLKSAITSANSLPEPNDQKSVENPQLLKADKPSSETKVEVDQNSVSMNTPPLMTDKNEITVGKESVKTKEKTTPDIKPVVKPQDNLDNAEYQMSDIDSEEVKEGLPEIHSDDNEDPNIDGKSDLDTKNESEQKPVKWAETPISSFNGDVSQREFFPNALPEGFTDDDDHFFPLFLTAVILVVLLYVLYHNKGKVSKVVLGLIVEGRQPGRRRNSRGHAYRRLDTLEQAMSANTAAPPSKIIY